MQTFTEELLRLPGCFLCYTPADGALCCGSGAPLTEFDLGMRLMLRVSAVHVPAALLQMLLLSPVSPPPPTGTSLLDRSML